MGFFFGRLEDLAEFLVLLGEFVELLFEGGESGADDLFMMISSVTWSMRPLILSFMLVSRYFSIDACILTSRAFAALSMNSSMMVVILASSLAKSRLNRASSLGGGLGGSGWVGLFWGVGFCWDVTLA